MQPHALCAALGLLACIGVGAAQAQAQEITADALRAAMSGNTLSATAGNNQVQAYYAPDGRVTLRVTGARMGEHTGTWEIEGSNQFCTRYTTLRGGTRGCNTVERLSQGEISYRAPEGNVTSGKLLKGNAFGM